MKLATLRYIMKTKNVKKDHILKDCPLVIDGDSYFRQTYKDSGCNFILGGEFDRFADHLKRTLTGFLESNVTCYVIFQGAMKMDLEKRKEIHQKLIDEKISMVPGDDKYCEPVFVKDVYRQVLEELGIRFCVCEYDARETLLDVSRKYKCPVVTNNIEYCLLNMDCITPSSIVFDNKGKKITCKIQTAEAHHVHFSLYDNMKPIFLSVFDENGPLFALIPEITGKPKNPVGNFLYWLKRHKREEAIEILAKKLSSEADRTMFKESVDEIRKIIFYKRESLAVEHFKSKSTVNLQSTDKDWFKKGILTGRIAIPYINLRNCGIFSGSWVVCDINREDAMLPAMDIVMFACGMLLSSQKNVITFIGRGSDKSVSGEISSYFPTDVSTNGIFTVIPNMFKVFVDYVFPSFDWSLLKDVPEDCWLLTISLVFYLSKSDGNFNTAVYSILLSYTMLGPVSGKVGIIKRSSLMTHSLETEGGDDKNACSYKDCLAASQALINYFYDTNLKKDFDRSLVHDLAEFQHCLQQMNYLNKLCGEKIPCTNYYRTYNGTFVFNFLLELKKQKNPMLYIENCLKDSPSVLQYYKHIKEAFDNCLSAAQKGK